MNDPRCMGMFESITKQKGDGCADFRGHISMLFEDLAQRRAATKVDDEISLAIFIARNIVNFDDARMTKLGRRSSFRDETSPNFRVFTQMFVDDLDRDFSTKTFVPGTIDRGHAAMPDLLQ
jgi:hypothetical protein